MTDRPTTTDDQLPLPIPAPSAVAEPAAPRARRKRKANRQLWLFAPYMQPELPLATTTPAEGDAASCAPSADRPSDAPDR